MVSGAIWYLFVRFYPVTADQAEKLPLDQMVTAIEKKSNLQNLKKAQKLGVVGLGC